MDSDGSNEVRLTRNRGWDGYPSWSPDGTQIAFSSDRDDPLDGTYEIYVMDADGSNVARLTDNDASVPAWSPDRTKIAFVSERYPLEGIYVMDADGSNVVRLTDSDFDDGPAWSPDGARIAFVSVRDGNDAIKEIYVMDADGSNVDRLTANEDGGYLADPAWSPDGTKIAFAFAPSGSFYEGCCTAISVMDAAGANVVQLTDSESSMNEHPTWSPDGTRIAFQSNWAIFVMDADGSNVTQLIDSYRDYVSPAWSPVAIR